MYESHYQEIVSDTVLNQQTDQLHVAVSDSGNSVIITVDEEDAAYTADDARALANKLEDVSDERWDQDTGRIVEYIHDVADVVDGTKSDEDIIDKWDLDE